MELIFEKCETSFAGPFSGRFESSCIWGVTGKSGSGKSTLMKCLADLIPHDGRISLDGTDQSAVSGSDWRKMVRFVHAHPVWWHDRVYEHFLDGELSSEVLRLMQLPDEIPETLSRNLSSGENKKLGLVRALQDMPRVVLLDEPSANLDGASREAIKDFIVGYYERSKALIVVVSHDEEWLGTLTGTRISLEEFTGTGVGHG